MALDDVSFKVPGGSICGLIGPNGAGKTTLINVISGLIPLTGGEILLEGKTINGLAPHKIAKMGIGRTFQNIRLFTELTVLSNVMIGYHMKLNGTVLEALFRLPRSRKEESLSKEGAHQLLKRLRMEHLETTLAQALSYGDQRRIEIARALASDPKLLLLDEPAAGMNATETDQLTEFLMEVRESSNVTLLVIVIEHDMDMIMRLSDSVVVLNFGMKLAEGPPDAVRENPQVIEAYLGEQD